MGQVRVAKAVWDSLPLKAQEARKAVENFTFLNEPVLDEVTQEYVWDDHRITEAHSFILEECRKLVPTKDDTDVSLRVLMEEKLYTRKISKERVGIELPDPVIVTEEQVSPSLEPSSSTSK